MRKSTNPNDVILYTYAPSLLLNLYMDSSILSTRYINGLVTLASLVNDPKALELLRGVVDEHSCSMDIDKVVDGLRRVSIISSTNPIATARRVYRLVSIIRDYENSNRERMLRWYSFVTGHEEESYSKALYSTKHTIKVTRAAIRQYLFTKAQGMVRRDVINSLMAFSKLLPSLLSRLLNAVKVESMAVILISKLVDTYRSDYPVRFLAEIAMRVFKSNAILFKGILTDMLGEALGKANYRVMLLAELAKVYVFTNATIDGLNIESLEDALSSVNNSQYVRFLVESSNIRELILDHMRRLMISSMNGDANSLTRLSRILGGIDPGLLKVIVDEWYRVIDEYS